MAELIDDGHLGNKTPEHGGFYRRVKEDGKNVNLVLDPKSGAYKSTRRREGRRRSRSSRRCASCTASAATREAFKVFARRQGRRGRPRPQGDPRLRQLRASIASATDEVVREPRDVDRIMGFGFNWAPPTVLVDVIGIKETISAIEKCRPAGAQGARQRQARRAAVPRARTSTSVASSPPEARVQSSCADRRIGTSVAAHG